MERLYYITISSEIQREYGAHQWFHFLLLFVLKGATMLVLAHHLPRQRVMEYYIERQKANTSRTDVKLSPILVTIRQAVLLFH